MDENGSITAFATGGSGGYFYSWSNGNIGAVNANLPNGDYVVLVTDAEGCTAAAAVELSSLTIPVVELGNALPLEEGATLVLNAENEGASYQWSNGATTQTLNVTMTGIYTVTVTNDLDCTAADSISIFSEEEVGISLITSLQSWKLVPNPAQQQTQIQLEVQEPSDLEINILEVSGRSIWHKQQAFSKGSHSLQLDIASWKAGLYWIVLKDKEGMSVRKMVKY